MTVVSQAIRHLKVRYEHGRRGRPTQYAKASDPILGIFPRARPRNVYPPERLLPNGRRQYDEQI
jgi:hypothetical protein